MNDYVDWRIMPGSPMENRGVTPFRNLRSGSKRRHMQGIELAFSDLVSQECNLFAWDGEHWGNPRISDGAPDIGFDERGLVIAAGNWANDSNSHNQPGFMHPTGVGSATRYFVLPRFVAGFDLALSNKYLRFHDTTFAPIAPNTGDGWVNPPGSLVSPTSLASLPVGYRTKYLSFATIPWAPISLSSLTTTWRPFGPASTQPVLTFLLASRFDDECDTTPCKHAYFNLQGVIMEDSSWPTATIEVLRGNMQAEYR
ncbi:MAG: hypothetical protein IPK60_20485 [Sandaracinaceae bacterium]|nr:hypothetical protein [Sandaracinaceae bacterium]